MKKVCVFLVTCLLSFSILSACSSTNVPADYESLVAENESLKAEIESMKALSQENLVTNEPEVIQDNKEDVSNQADVEYTLSAEKDFRYVNNGSEVQINEYLGNGGNIIIPDTIEGNPVTRIASNAFEKNDRITAIKLPNCLQIIGDNAFYGLKNMKCVVVFPKSISEIGGHAFQSSGITGAVIQSNCEIGINAFANIGSLELFYVTEDSSPQIGHAVFGYSGRDLPSFEVVLPASVTSIKDETFDNCNNIIIYTSKGSTVIDYANRNFIQVNTNDYQKMVEKYASLY